MKIVRVIARLNVGGPARHVVWLTAGLRRPDCESLLVAGRVPPGEEDMGYFAASQGVEPVLIPELTREISLKDALTVWKLYRLFRREAPDIVHTHTAKAGTVGRVAGLLYRWLTPLALLGRPRRCLFVHTYHGHIFHSYYGRLKTRLFIAIERALARLVTDQIVVVSEQQRQEIHETFGVGRANQFAVIRLGLDLTAFADWQRRRPIFRAELGAKDNEVLVGIVGRLTEIKNHRFFLQAVARFKQITTEDSSLPRVRFVVIGDGNLRGSLESETRRLGLSEKVIFTGSRTDPENFYPALDIVALSSLNEGTPLTLIEAMANERPVIATAVGGVVDLLGDAIAVGKREREGYVICPRGVSTQVNDTEAFAAGLNRLVKDAELRQALGARGAAFVSDNYSKDRLLEDVRALYDQMLQPHQPNPVKTRTADKSLESRV